jgi:hypothetical protein
MISLIQKFPVGNSLRLFVTPPAGVTKWRILRKSADTFTGAGDTSAYVVSENDSVSVVDAAGLVNGSTYFYRSYYWDGAAWLDSGLTVSSAPASTYDDYSTDVVSVLRERIALGLAVEIQRGTLRHEQNKIPVLIASPTFEDTKWPVVTIHVANDSDGHRFIGEMVESDEFISDDFEWVGHEGWLSRVQITIGGWDLNQDGRMALRKALKRILIGNLPVFDAAGMYEITISQSDNDEFQAYPAPVYQALTQFSCLARSAVSSVEDAIREVVMTANVT